MTKTTFQEQQKPNFDVEPFSTHAEILKIRRLVQLTRKFRVEIEMMTIWNDVRWQKTKLLELKDTWNRSNIS